jgi:membrane associated rhomboid family serine protease
MIFPIGDENIQGASKPYFTYILIALNILIFFYMMTLPQGGIKEIYNNFATTPTEILNGQEFYTLMTNMFLHGGILHLAGNMLFLWIFADNIEIVLGKVYFLFFYLAGGIFASLAHVFSNMGSSIPSLGASGALAAVMGAYLVFFPKSKVKVLVIYLFRNVHISALWFLGAWFAMQLFSSFSQIGSDPNSAGTAWMAHIGGFVFGFLVAFGLKKMGIVNPSKYKVIA